MDTNQDRGIEALKSLTEFVILSFEATLNVDANQDRKVSFAEALNLVTQIGFKMPGVYDQLPAIKAEWKDLSDQEIQDMVSYFADRFDLPKNDKLEKIIRITAKMLVSNYLYYRDMRSILAPTV